MRLKEAIELSKKFPGSYVKMNKQGCWSEYWTQYFWKGDLLLWTAGMTTGGEADLSILEDSDYYFVFKEWMNDHSIVTEYSEED